MSAVSRDKQSAMEGRALTVEASEGAPTTPAFAVVPPGARRGVVVIHEVFGPQPEINRVVERFGRAGYAAIAPDLFHGRKLRCLVEFFRGLRSTDGSVVEDLVAVRQMRSARAWLCREAGLAPANVGLIGFCFGGGFALVAAAGWAAVSTNYGAVPSVEVLKGIGPVIGCYGGRDKVFGPKSDELVRKLRQVGVTPEVHRFEDAGHSFLTDGHHPIAKIVNPRIALGDYPEAREEGWKRIFAFFDRQLAPAAAR